MRLPRMAALVAAALVAGASLALANEMGVPGVSEGGEFAYVREYPSDGLETADAGEHLTATYVGFTVDEHPQRDRLIDFESRGRVADSQLFHQIDVPDGTFGDLRFVSVDHIERGIFVGEGPSACFAVLNGVNAGTALIAQEPIDARYRVVDAFDLEQVDNGTVDLQRDGHTYRMQVVGNGTVSIDGSSVLTSLGPGAELRGWIIDEYPATTQVMHASFDDLSCGAEAAPAPGGPDVAVDKEVADQTDQHVIFSIAVASVGDENATNVSLVDELPETNDTWILGGDDSEQCDLDNGTLTCDFGDMDVGDQRSVTVKSYIDEACGELSNTATVSADSDSNASNDQDTAVASLEPCDEEPDTQTNETGQPSNETEQPTNETAPESEQPSNETEQPSNETADEPREAEASFCPRTQGYWKNHEEAWPVDELTMGNDTYSKQEALELFDTPPRGDASLILAHQLMAARLNEASGANTSAIDDVLADADAALAEAGRVPTGTPASSEAGQNMTALSEEIDAWNNQDCDGDMKTQTMGLQHVTPGIGWAAGAAALAGIGATAMVIRRR